MRWNQAGIRWQDIKDQEMRDLAEWRALQGEPHLSWEEVLDNHEGTIDVTFGSTGATIMLRDPYGYEARSLFGFGYCAILALALHDRSGLPLIIFTATNENGNWSGHAAVVTSEDEVLDITGIRSHQSVHQTYGRAKDVQIVTREEFVARIFSKEHQENPYNFVEPLEAWITHEFADHLVTENVTTVN